MLQVYSMFCYPSNDNNMLIIITYGQGFGILFRSVKDSMLLKKLTSALLRGLRIMAASKPISLST